MTPQPLRVIKVGGSLLRNQPAAQARETDALPDVLALWLARQTPAINVLIAGGGEFADIIRRADETHHIGQEAAHWLCVDAMSVNARLLGAILNAAVVTQANELTSVVPSICVFDPGPFLRDIEPLLFSTPLPHTWDVTSDSIAVRVALSLSADEFVLLKACLPASNLASYIDAYFPLAAAGLTKIRCVNLRSPDFEETNWINRL